jgi:hypothetical protein
MKASATWKKKEEKPKSTARNRSVPLAGLAKARRLQECKRTQEHRLKPMLLIFGVDAEGAGGVEGGVEGFGFFDEDVGELFFLVEGDGLELDHFEEG